jgi:hypothetical protein
MKDRNLTVEPHYYRTTWREKKTSKIRLKGKWLEKAGFLPGDRVDVKVDKKKILITIRS